jgi:hypothetical protein
MAEHLNPITVDGVANATEFHLPGGVKGAEGVQRDDLTIRTTDNTDVTLPTAGVIPAQGADVTFNNMGLTGSMSAAGYVSATSGLYSQTTTTANKRTAIFFQVPAGPIWQIGTDSAGNGTSDFYIFDQAAGFRITISPAGMVTITGGINASANVTANAFIALQGGSYTSDHWKIAYDERRQWDGGAANLNAANGRANLGINNIWGHMYRATALTATNGWMAVPFDTVVSASSVTLSGTRATVQVAGIYYVYGSLIFSANATGIRYIALSIDTQYFAQINATPTAANPCSLSCAGMYYASVGDYFELNAYQNTGAGLAISVGSVAACTLGIAKMNPT